MRVVLLSRRGCQRWVRLGNRSRGKWGATVVVILAIAEYVQVASTACLVRSLLYNIVPKTRLQTRLFIHQLTELILWQLKQGAETRRSDDFGTPNKALPKRWIGPYLLGYESREQRRRHKANQRLVSLHRLDHLRGRMSLFDKRSSRTANTHRP